MKIYIPEPIHERPLAMAREHAQVVTWEDPGVMDWTDADAVIVRTTKVTRERMLAAPKLKIVAKHGMGTDNIDIPAAAELGVTVTNTPTANTESVAELAVTLALACARKIGQAVRTEGTYDHISPRELSGTELQGKTVGLIGLGKIGYRTGCILRDGFGMAMAGYDPFVTAERAQELGVTKYETLPELFANADVLTISVPLTEGTRHLVNAQALQSARKGAILVNTARGGIVDEDALYAALKGGPLAAAAMDVFASEPPTKDNPLLTLDNFISTPHIGAATEEALIRMGTTAVEEILRVLGGQPPRYPVR